MPKGYQHLTYEQRCQIYALLRRETSKNQIAQQLGVHQSTISREVKKNAGLRGYRYKQAHQKASTRRRKASSRNSKMTPGLSLLVEEYLYQKQWSPEQISGYLQKQGIFISHERIYQYVWTNKKSGGDLYKNLRNKGKKYNKRGNKLAGRGLIPNRVDIEKRPCIVDQKIRVGDFEVDTIVGANHKGAIVSVVERKTMLTRLAILERATADATAKAIINLVQPFKKHAHTFTADNGKEFAYHEKIAKQLNLSFFFAKPYHAWQRGLNENINRLVRQYFPKKTNFDTVTQDDVEKVEQLLNSRPRKSLKFETPGEVFFHHTGIKLTYALRG